MLWIEHRLATPSSDRLPRIPLSTLPFCPRAAGPFTAGPATKLLACGPEYAIMAGDNLREYRQRQQPGQVGKSPMAMAGRTYDK
jgi:hypothetical protein